MAKETKFRDIIGWLNIALSFLIVSFWSYWGINETFHEGWYYSSFWQNIYLTFVQYLSIPVVFLVAFLIALNYKKVGSALLLIFGIISLFFFKSNAGRFLIFIPFLLLSLSSYFGSFKNKKVASYSLITIFFLIILSFGIPQLIKVENRFNDYNFQIRIIEGSDFKLAWAPQGEGFPVKGTSWQIAKRNCALLNEEGTNLENKELNIWRLPTKLEIVSSMTRNNTNSGGVIDNLGTAQYEIKPDKETPLWNPLSPIIYYWTSDLKNQNQAFLVSYNGIILERNKDSGANYQGYRCVKNYP